MEGDRNRLDERGLLERKVSGQAVEDVLWDGDVLGKRAVLPVVVAGHPEHPAVVAQVDQPAAAVVAVAAVDSRVEGDAIADLPAGHCRAHLRDDARRLVAHDHRRDAPARAAVQAVYVAAADAAGLDLHEDFLWANHRLGHVPVDEMLILFQN